ncbi:MAG: group III truncated hemoglobin [Vicinamibacterales bacterium]
MSLSTADAAAASGAARMDIASRAAIVQMVDTFYERIGRDDVLGLIFNDVARVDWAVHLPKMYDFWESVLFGTATFKGNPLVVHQALARKTALTEGTFSRWIALFHRTVDDLFQGPVAEEAKRRASMIAATLQYRVNVDPSGRGD